MANKSDRPLTNKQLAFCREYCVDSNGKQAAIRAGYSVKGAEVRASELLIISKVKREISRLLEQIGAEVGMTVERVQDMYQEARQLAITNNQPSAAVSAITGIARLYGMDKDASQDKADQPTSLTPERATELQAMAKRETQLKLSKGTG